MTALIYIPFLRYFNELNMETGTNENKCLQVLYTHELILMSVRDYLQS